MAPSAPPGWRAYMAKVADQWELMAREVNKRVGGKSQKQAVERQLRRKTKRFRHAWMRCGSRSEVVSSWAYWDGACAVRRQRPWWLRL